MIRRSPVMWGTTATELERFYQSMGLRMRIILIIWLNMCIHCYTCWGRGWISGPPGATAITDEHKIVG